MRRFYAGSILGGLILMLPGMATAQLYASVAMGRTDFSFTGESATSLNIHAGRFFAPNLALDLGYIDLGTLDGNNTSLDLGGVNIAAKGQIPLSPELDIFARLGLFAWKIEEDYQGSTSTVDDSIDVSYGLGGAYRFSENFALFLEYNGYNMDAYDASGVSLGGRVSF